MVARLDVSDSSTLSSPPTSEPALTSRSRESSTTTQSPAVDDDVQLPARTTHGGDYGASIRERVIASYRVDRRR